MKRRRLCVYLEYLKNNEMKVTTELQGESKEVFE